MKTKKKYNNLKYFFISMAVSEIILVSFLGLIIAEHNIRYIILGSEEALFEYDISSAHKSITFVFMGEVFEIDFNFIFSSIKNIFFKIFY